MTNEDSDNFAAADIKNVNPAVSIQNLGTTEKSKTFPEVRSLDLAESEDSSVSHVLWPWISSNKNNDLDSIATARSVFDDPDLAPHYAPKPEYENAHRYDPDERWTYREENAVCRAIDWKNWSCSLLSTLIEETLGTLLPTTCLMI